MATSNVERGSDHRVVSFTQRASRKSKDLSDEIVQERVPIGVDLSSGDHLPRQPGALLGREAELELIHVSLLSGSIRLLTLTGSGGVGKTRLAIEAAGRDAEAFPDGAWFVDLTPAEGPDGVVSALAESLMVQETRKLNLLASLKRHVGERSMLLVLDSLEPSLDSSGIVIELVAACPHLTLLATSREPIHLRTEHVMPVGPLEVPGLDDLPPLDELAHTPAVALFLQRAQSMRLDFCLTETNADDIARICVQLEGHPLAIELAASQISYLSPAALVRRLIDHPMLLRGRAQDVPERHRSLSDAIEWTYQKLDEDERTLFRQLSVFVEGFSIDAAHDVAAPGTGTTDLLILLASLVDKSLLQSTVTDNSEPWFVIPELLRSYGQEQLARDPDRGDAYDRHASYYLLLVERAAIEIQGPDRGTWLARLDMERKNFDAAIQWAGESHDSELELRLVCALAGYWWFRDVRTGIQMLQHALQHCPEAGTRLHAKALNWLGVLLRWTGAHDQAITAHGSALATGEALMDASLGATTRMNIGAALLAAGRYSEARVELDEALSACERAGDTWAAAQTVLHLATVALAEGDIALGEAHAAESLTVFQSLGDEAARASALSMLAWAAAANGDVSAAVTMLRNCLQLIQRSNEYHLISLVAEEVAWLASVTEIAHDAAQLLAGAEALCRQAGFVPTAFERHLVQAALERLRVRLEESALVRDLETGQTLSQEELVDRALTILSDLDTRAARESISRESSGSDVLSRREQEVLELVAQGLSNKQIADNLTISENTAKFHVTSILNKLGANSRAQIVALAARRHLLPR